MVQRLLEALAYAAAVGCFSFVFVAAVRMRHELLLLACIPPVFMAIIMGFIMGIYAWDNFGLITVLLALCAPIPLAWRLGGHYSPRDLLVTIYLAWAIGLVLALIALQFPDVEDHAAAWRFEPPRVQAGGGTV